MQNKHKKNLVGFSVFAAWEKLYLKHEICDWATRPNPAEAMAEKDFRLFQLGKAQYRRQSYEEACATYEELIASWPDSRFSPVALQKWIRIKFAAGNENEILPYLNSLEKSTSALLLAHIDKLEVLVNRKLNIPNSALSAIGEYKSAAKTETDQRFYSYQEGLIYKNDLGNTKKAQSVFLEYLERFPDDYRVPMVKNQLKKMDVAEALFSEKSYPGKEGREGNVSLPDAYTLFNPCPNPFGEATPLG